jgi:hypothetical protein
MGLNLLPECATRERGKRDDAIPQAIALDAIALLNELQMAIDSGTSASLLGWVRDAALRDESVPAQELIEPLRKIYDQVARAQSKLISAVIRTKDGVKAKDYEV